MKHKTAFSLIELMVVIAIIGVLAAVAVPSYRTYVSKSKVASGFTQIEEYTKRLITYFGVEGELPPIADRPDFTTGANGIESFSYWRDSARTGRVNLIFTYDSDTLPSESNRNLGVSIACSQSKKLCRKFCGWRANDQESYMDLEYLPGICQNTRPSLDADAYYDG